MPRKTATPALTFEQVAKQPKRRQKVPTGFHWQRYVKHAAGEWLGPNYVAGNIYAYRLVKDAGVR